MTNTIGIIVAMDKELALLKPMIENPMTVSVNGYDYIVGQMGSRQVIAGKCGIGKVNAAIGALSLIDTFHPVMVINTGVAGGTGATDNPAKIQDLVLASEVAYHDVWCGPGTVPGQAANCPPRFKCPLPESVREKLGAKEGLVASGDVFVDSKDVLERILTLYPEAIAVDMESGAIAQACHMKDVPFVCLRVVSDTPGEDGNAAAYSKFWEDAPVRTLDAVEKLLQLL